MGGRGGTDDKIVRINVKKKAVKKRVFKRKTSKKGSNAPKSKPPGAKKKVKKAVRRKPTRRTAAQLERDYKTISLLYFVQCWKVADIAQHLDKSVRTIEGDIKKIREGKLKMASRTKQDELRNDILDGVQEKYSERVRNLWNEYVDLSNRINDLEKPKDSDSEKDKKRKEGFTAVSLRKMRLKVLEILRREDSDLVERLRKMGILEGEIVGDEDENEVQAEIRRRYEHIQKIRRDAVAPPRTESEGTRIPSGYAGNRRSVNGDTDSGDNE